MVQADEDRAGRDERAWFYYNRDDVRDCVLEGTHDAPGFLADTGREYVGWQRSVDALAEAWEACREICLSSEGRTVHR